MQEISYKDLIPNTEYFIEIPRKIYYGPIYNKHMDIENHGLFVKQKGVFVIHKYYGSKNCNLKFKNIFFISRTEKGRYFINDTWIDSEYARFYLPATVELMNKVNYAEYILTNTVLRKLIGDPYFIFYETIL